MIVKIILLETASHCGIYVILFRINCIKNTYCTGGPNKLFSLQAFPKHLLLFGQPVFHSFSYYYQTPDRKSIKVTGSSRQLVQNWKCSKSLRLYMLVFFTWYCREESRCRSIKEFSWIFVVIEKVPKVAMKQNPPKKIQIKLIVKKLKPKPNQTNPNYNYFLSTVKLLHQVSKAFLLWLHIFIMSGKAHFLTESWQKYGSAIVVYTIGFFAPTAKSVSNDTTSITSDMDVLAEVCSISSNSGI